MRALFLLSIIFSFSSCLRKERTHSQPVPEYHYVTVWGNKPVYADINTAKQVLYIDSAFPVRHAGNICALGNRIYQVETGRGIHIIDNSVPSQAHRIGFIMVNGTTQISIKDNNLYTNCYDDLVVIDISDVNAMQVLKKVEGAFPNGISSYYLIEPEDTGYYRCPTKDSVVIGWEKDSILNTCYKR